MVGRRDVRPPQVTRAPVNRLGLPSDISMKQPATLHAAASESAAHKVAPRCFSLFF